MVLLGFPLGFDVEVITSLPQVVEASCMTKVKSPTRQVLVILKGAPITTLDLGNWGSYKLRTYVPKSLRCFTCQKFEHHQANCKAKAKCGVCSEAHETGVYKGAQRWPEGHNSQVSKLCQETSCLEPGLLCQETGSY